MDYTTVFVGMDVHKEIFSLCCYTNEKETVEHNWKVTGHYSKILNYIEAMRNYYGDDTIFVCGYEAGCLGFTLYHQLTTHGVKCIVVAPTSIPVPAGQKKMKTDKRDAGLIAQCLAHHSYREVHVPTDEDEQVKEYIRMRDDHKLMLKKTKQQILAFCLRHNLRYDTTKSYWTQAHLKWLRSLNPEDVYKEILDEYLVTLSYLTEKISRFDQRIEDFASQDEYREKVSKLSCFLGIKTVTALSTIVETGDFHRFGCAEKYASYLGLVPGEYTSSEDRTNLGITKAGNSHLRRLLVEAAQSYGHGQAGHKSKLLADRQKGNPSTVIAYADRANERLRRKYYRMVLNRNKRSNVAKTAVARELACFIWGMMTDNIA
jgi:transposase